MIRLMCKKRVFVDQPDQCERVLYTSSVAIFKADASLGKLTLLIR